MKFLDAVRETGAVLEKQGEPIWDWHHFKEKSGHNYKWETKESYPLITASTCAHCVRAAFKSLPHSHILSL